LTASQQQAAQNALNRAQFASGLLGQGYGATAMAGQQNLSNALQLGQFASGQATQALQQQQQAEELARNRLLANIQTGQGLFGGALNLQQGGYGAQQAALAPFGTTFQQANAVEQAGLQPFTLGVGLGSPITAAAQAAAAAQAQGQSAANQLNLNRNTAVAGALADPVSKLIGKLFGG
jgi:hypothetical protein